jgi:hypothetical protein
MKQELCILVDCEYLRDHPDKLDLVKMFIEFGAPISIEEDNPEPIEIFRDMEFAYLDWSKQNLYRWVKEVENGPGGIVVWIRENGLPIIHKRKEF